MTLDAVLLIAFGGPTRPDEIRPFLNNVARGRRIRLERLEDVAHHYEQMPGGRSPLNDLTFMQARSLAAMLAGVNLKLPVFVGMRNWRPYLHETLATMGERGVGNALGIILSALRTEASWERYMNDVGEARARTPGAPAVAFAPPFFDHPLFVEAVADRARAALAPVPQAEQASTPPVFPAHSLPTPMANGSPYVDDFNAASAAVAKRLHHGPWRLAYQSRSGSPRDPWLEPGINDTLQDLRSAGGPYALVVPLRVLCDPVEGLYGPDVEAAPPPRAAGPARPPA